MNTNLLAALVVVPILAVVLTSLARNPRVARSILLAASALTSAIAVLLSTRVWFAPASIVSLDFFHSGRGLAFSAARAPVLCISMLAFLVVALLGDRRQLGVVGSNRTSIALCAVVLANLATGFAALAAAFTALAAVVVVDVTGAGTREARTDARASGFVLAIGSVALIVGAVATRAENVLAPLATEAHAALDLTSVPMIARRALVVACMVGLAVFPFHLHLPRVFARATIGPAVGLVVVQPVLVVAMHAVLPTLGTKEGDVMSALAIVSILGAAYSAFGAIGQRELRPMLGYLVASQNGLALAGLATRTIEGGVAGVLSSMATALTGAGLLIIAHEIESRAGAVDLRGSYGFAKPWPRLGVAYLLLALASIGFPGSLQFFSEDLLLQGFLASHPVLAYAVLLVAASNGVTILRSFFVLFFGPNVLERADYVPGDLRRRELIGPVILLSAMVGLVAVGPTIGALVER